MKETKKTLLIDADILLYEIGRLSENKTTFKPLEGEDDTHPEIYCESWDEHFALSLLGQMLDKISETTGFDSMILCLSDEANFRKRLFPTYKLNRKDVKKPLGMADLRKWCLENVQTMMGRELEADDVMGILATKDPEGMAIYSQDKDLKTIPIQQWDFKLNKFIYPNMKQALKFLYTQVLTGDTCDGYTGVPGIGKVKAAAILAPCRNEMEMFQATKKAYEAFYKDPELAKTNFLYQIGQARILHNDDLPALRDHDKTYNPYEKFGEN